MRLKGTWLAIRTDLLRPKEGDDLDRQTTLKQFQEERDSIDGWYLDEKQDLENRYSEKRDSLFRKWVKIAPWLFEGKTNNPVDIG